MADSKVFYYARVSTREQNLDRQIAAFKAIQKENIQFSVRSAQKVAVNRPKATKHPLPGKAAEGGKP